MTAAAEIAALIEPDRVHRSIYTDASLFERELDRIWGRTWIYVGHDSQVPKPGDYYATSIGRQPVIMIRQKDGEIAVLHNRCPHKGVQLLVEGAGSAPLIRCPYHGWTFRPDGSLRTRPMEDGYAATCFGRDDPGASMQRTAQGGSYRGFVFASLSPDVPPLEEWLGGVASSIDNMVDRAPAGRLEVAGGVLRYLHKCNWKFFVENLNDLMHPMVAHQSSSGTARQVAKGQAAASEGRPEVEILSPFTSSYEAFEAMGVSAFPHGHSYSGGTRSIHDSYSGIDDYDRAMISAYGKSRTAEILSVQRHNTVVYPSLTLKGPIQTIRVVKPLAVDRTLVESWAFRLVGAPDAMLARTILYSNLINSSANLVGPDDHAAYRRLQSGLLSTGADWVSMHRHPDTERLNDHGGFTAPGTSDLVFRNQYRAWADYMGGMQ